MRCTARKSSPRSPQLEKARTQQQRPNVAKNKLKKKSLVQYLSWQGGHTHSRARAHTHILPPPHCIEYFLGWSLLSPVFRRYILIYVLENGIIVSIVSADKWNRWPFLVVTASVNSETISNLTWWRFLDKSILLWGKYMEELPVNLKSSMFILKS